MVRASSTGRRGSCRARIVLHQAATHMRLRILPPVLATLAVSLFAGSGIASGQTTITVTTTDQQSATHCTLSDAINAINTWLPFGGCPTGQGVDTIHVPAGVYELAAYAVDESGELTALPYITRPIRIVGDGPGATVIRRAATAPAMRLFKFQAPFEIEGMTLAGGAANHYRGGGAILAETFNVAGNAHMTATARNMVFEDNAAPQGGALADAGFWFGPFVEFTLDQVVFTGNSSTGGGGAIYLSPGSVVNATGSRFEDNTAAAWGGAIYNHSGGQVTIADSQFLRNISTLEGGGIHAASPVLTRVTFDGNEAATGGGGALYSYGGRPVITGSTFIGNRARRGGAVEVNAGSVAIDASTFAANTAFTTEGGALWLDDRLRTSRITNSTFSANLTASYGAIALINGGVTIINSTIVFNTNTPGGWSAGVSAGFSGSNEVFLSNSIVAGNTSDGAAIDLRVDAGSGGDRFVSLGHNLIGSNEYVADVFSSATGDLFGTMAAPLAAGLLPLADNGGPTPTHALAAGSAAFDAGSLASPGTDDACLPIDQRGSPRPGVSTAACDIGAVESEVLIVPGGSTTTSVSASLNPSTLGEAVTFTAIVTAEPGAVGTPTGLVTFTEITTNVVLGSIAIDAAGIAAFTTSALPSGLLTIQAAYAGDGVFTGSSSTLGQTVVAPPAPTTTTLVSSANPSTSGAPVTLTATVTTLAPGSAPVGSVAFVLSPGNTELGAAPIDAGGVAALTLSTLPEGTLQIEATYLPAGLFIGSAASVTQVVSPLPDAAIRNGVPESRAAFSGVGTLLTGAGRPSCTGTMVSEFVVLTAAQCVRNAALADVTFSLGNSRSALATSITAHPRFDTADGINLAFDVALVMLDRDMAGAWSDVARTSLAAAPPTPGVVATAVGFGSSRTSGQLIVNRYLAGEDPIGVPIAGAFIEAVPDDAANQMFCEPGRGGPLFSEGLVAGIASFRFVETCVEPGPGYYVTVSRLTSWVENTIDELEAVAPTTIELSSSPNPSVENQMIAFEAVVSGMAPGGRVPTGTVTFEGAGAAPVIIALNDGRAVLAVGNLPLGSHTIRAAYSGDAVFAPAETTIEQVVRIQTFPLTITWTGPGDVVGADFQPVCAASPCVIEYDKNSTITLRPRAHTDLLSRLLGVTFVEWSGDCIDGACTVTMTGPKTVSASFVHGRKVTVSGLAYFYAASFAPCPQYLLCDGIVTPGTQVTITAYPVPHLRFKTWTGSPCQSQSQWNCTFTMGMEEVNAVAYHETTGSGGETPGTTPIARITRLTPGFGPARATGPLTPVGLSAASSTDPDGSGEALTFRWIAGSTTATGPSFTPQLPLGRTVITLEATDADGHTGTAQLAVTVADLTPPVIRATSLLVESATTPTQLPAGIVTAVDAVWGPVSVRCSSRLFASWQTPAMLVVGENQVRCTAGDVSGNDTTVTFQIALRVPDLTNRAEMLVNATTQTPGATAAMRKAATRVANAVGSGANSGVCTAVTSYRHAVSSALSAGLITAAGAEPLLAIANEMLAMAGC